jgi:transposase
MADGPHGRAVGGTGAVGAGGEAARQDAARRPAPDHGGDLWRHQNGAKWRAIPAGLGPWWKAAQTFIRWARKGVWERLLELVQERAGGADLGMASLDGTSIRAHAKAAGAAKKGELARAETSARRLVVLVAAMGPRP